MDLTRDIPPGGARTPSGQSENWEARLARNLVRSAHKSATRGVAVGIVAAAWLILTISGSYLGSNEATVGGKIGDAIYNALTFLAPRDGYGGVGRFAPLPTALWWGRFFGVALSMLAIVWAALYRSRGIVACLLIRARARGHVVILSADGFADELARGRAEEGHCVVLVERGVSTERIFELGRAGVVVMPEAVSFARWLEECRVGSAAAVLCWMASDSLGLANAFAARRAIGRSSANTIVRLDSPEMQRSLRSAPELLQTEEGRLIPVSATVHALRAALAGSDLVETAVARGQKRVHVALHGDTPALGLAASFLLRHNWSIHLAPPAVSWIAEPSARAWHDWRLQNYAFLEHAVAAMGADAAPQIDQASALTRAENEPILLHIVDYGDDDRTMARAFDLASRLAQEAAHPTPVRAVLRKAHAVRELLRHSRTLSFADPILIDSGASFRIIPERGDEAREAHLHNAYLHQFGRHAPVQDPWNKLAETYVHANRAASDHGAIKRYDRLRAAALGIDHAAALDAMARIEHNRWMVERLLDGWAPAAVRNNDRRLHDKLVPWDVLGAADRANDAAAVQGALDRIGADAAPAGIAPAAMTGA